MKKSQNYAELNLYFAFVQNMGIGEGKFNPDDNSSWTKNRFYKAMERVRNSLNPNFDYLFHNITQKMFVSCEEEAKKVINFSEKNITGAYGKIELIDSLHGRVRFLRQIRFEDWGKNEVNDLVEMLKLSNVDSEYNALEYNEEGNKFSGWKSILEFY